MKIRTFLLPILLILAASATRAEKLWVAKEGSVPVWLRPDHEASEAPLLEAGGTEPLLELDSKDGLFKVKTTTGMVGWIEASKVRAWKKGEGSNIDLGEGKVSGYLDNPNSVYILDDSKDPPEAFQIHRDLSILVSLEDNIDRESLERKYGENN
jgi:hypothetical protein